MLIFISVIMVLILAYHIYMAVVSYKEDDTFYYISHMIFAALMTVCSCLCIMQI